MDTKVQAMLDALVQQRNMAQNQVAELLGELAGLKEENDKLKAEKSVGVSE